ncbi:hypothetical protein QJQ45_012937 [Haematococcus lacustris]|nr:hypothetical protein QJQ45_012937 [Haematococcus lacustris]
MPQEGVLKVCVMRRATVPARSPTLGPVLEACTLSQLRSDLVSDAWRSLLVGRVVSITFVTACQAARLLSTFAYRTEKLNAAVLLLSMCTDPAAFLPSMQAAQPLPLPPLASADPNHDPLPLLSPHRHTTPTGLAKAAPKPQTLCEQSSSPVDSDGLLPATSSHPSPSSSPLLSPPSLNHPSSARSEPGLGLEAEVRAGQQVVGERAGEPKGQAMGLGSSAQCSCMLLSWRWGEEQLRNHRRLLHGPVLAGSEVEELLGHPWLQASKGEGGKGGGGEEEGKGRRFASMDGGVAETLQVHLLLAATLLDLAARPLRSLPIVLQDMSRPSRAVQAADGIGPPEWIWQPRSLGWRSELPGPSGTTRASLVMEFDLVNVHIRSFTHKALGSRASVTMQEARTAAPLASAPPRLRTLVTSVGVILHAANTGFRNNPDAPGTATTNLLSGLMTATGSSKGLGSTGPDTNPNPAAKPLTAMWPAAGGRPPPLSRAAANARSVRIACATAYGQLYSRCVELLGLLPNLCYTHGGAAKAAAPPAPRTTSPISTPLFTHPYLCVRGRRDEGIDRRAASQGKKVHKGKQAGAGVSRPGIKAEREAAAAAEHQRLRLAAAVKRAAAVVPIMIAHGAEYLVTVHQLVHLLRLLPQMAMRQTVLMAALPALADPGNTLLAVLDLDCPVPLALLPAEQESLNAASAAATASVAAGASHAEQPWLRVLAAATASPDGWSPHAGCPAAGPSPDKVASAGPDGGGDASSPALPPLDIPSCLLRQVVPCIGWRAVRAHWGCVELIDQELEFNLNRVDELSVAAGLLRFLDRCRGMPDYGSRPALVSAMTDAGPVKLQHEDDLWSYYEQVLSWACARTKLALPPPPPPQPLTPVAHTPTQSVMPLPAGSSSVQNSKQAVGNMPGKTPAKKGAAPQPSMAASPKLSKEGAEAQEEGEDVGGGCAAAPVPALALGLLRVRVAISWEQRLWSAAVLLQAAWRGWRLRRALARALYAEVRPAGALAQARTQGFPSSTGGPTWVLARPLLTPTCSAGAWLLLRWLGAALQVLLVQGRSGMGMGGGEHAGGQGGLGKAVTGRLTPPNAAHSARLSGGGVLEEDEVFNPPLQASQGLGTYGNSGSGAAGDASADGRPDASTASIGGGLEARDPTAAGSLRPPTKVLSRSQSRGPFMAQLREQCSSTRSFVFSRSSTAVTTLSRAADDVRGPDLTAAATVHSTSATAADAGGYPAPPSRWKGTWAVWKFARRVAQMQRAGGQLFLTHARSELDANADHLQGPILLV